MAELKITRAPSGVLNIQSDWINPDSSVVRLSVKTFSVFEKITGEVGVIGAMKGMDNISLSQQIELLESCGIKTNHSGDDYIDRWGDVPMSDITEIFQNIFTTLLPKPNNPAQGSANLSAAEILGDPDTGNRIKSLTNEDGVIKVS